MSFAFTEPRSEGPEPPGRGKAERGRRKGGMMEGAREGGSEVRGVKERCGGAAGERACGTGSVRERGVR